MKSLWLIDKMSNIVEVAKFPSNRPEVPEAFLLAGGIGAVGMSVLQ